MPPSTMNAGSGALRCRTADATSSGVGWREGDGRALAWWLEKLNEPRLCARLVDGVDRYA